MGPQDPRLGPGSEQDVGQSLIQGHLPKIWGPEDGSSIEKRHRIFKPMTAVLYPKAPKRPLSDQERALRQQKGISDNYEGNPENPKNQSANIPNEENCALFLTNLPARCSYQTLLRAIAQHRMGRVWSTYINSPLGEEQHEHQQRQAQDPSPAHHYGASIRGDFRVGGRRIHAKWNRHRTAAQSYENPTSRVVVISGPAAIVDRQWLGDLFDQYFEYQTEEVLVLAEGNGWRTLEWRFGSMRAQAHSAHQLLRSLYPGVVTVKWAVDPCAGYLKLLGEV
ncbi:hypothetical protein M406DRAFT_262487 [Cryphonectria parasitica EP155]|uniref:Uncharacterized protein n=1 Tax=Cryphonectria parasitica (strain ATCC 38755 / EP155) TaxID=660469 RepID=A0A9P5CMY8_CRYP1|nr:uncharacterized protein M406DRAFT_262487 [Cryphonectria parasitica EP155]KAF3763581.1 hypothetical protein M406DRAFT_262487 [Cryphonectria parasitica EP155]